MSKTTVDLTGRIFGEQANKVICKISALKTNTSSLQERRNSVSPDFDQNLRSFRFRAGLATK